MKVFELIDPLFLPHCGCELQVSVSQGKALVLIGENGLGKTTLLHRFYLEIPPDKRVVVEQKTSEYFFDRKLKTIKQFLLEAELKGFNQKAFQVLWNNFDLSSKEERLISNLSGGESQALKLCMSLCKEADYYFLDEPSQYLDESKKKVLLNFLESLLLQEKTLLLVEHNREWLPSGWDIQELKIENNTLVQGAKWTT